MNAPRRRPPRRAWLAILAGLLATFALAMPALAQAGAITVSNAKVESKFSEYVRFSISAIGMTLRPPGW